MLIVHGTVAFRDRIPHQPADDATSTTALGPWYANLVRWQKPMALFVNERTLLPVVVPLAPAKTLLARLPDAIAEVMTALGAPADFVAAEVAAMREVRAAPTANRSVVGVLNDSIRMLGWYREHDGDLDPLTLSLRLAARPVGAPNYTWPEDALREAAGLPPRVRRAPPPPEPADRVDSIFPTSIPGPDGQRIEIRRQRGLADDVMRELKPLLLADGIDMDDPDNPPEMADLQAAMDRAVERRNLELFTPIAARRDAAAAFLMQFTALIADHADALAAALLARVEPEAHDDQVPEVAAVIGLALDLLDAWLTGRADGVPQNLAAGARVPPGWKREGKAATEILALAARGRGFSSHAALIARQGGERVLAGCAVAVAAAAQAWSRRTGEPVDTLLLRVVR